MGEQINKEFDDFQKHLEKKEKQLKIPISFETGKTIDEELEELKRKDVVL